MQPSKMATVIGIGSALFLLAGAVAAQAEDCNSNGILDECDIDCGTSGGPCDVPGCGESEDCNSNGVPDECDIGAGTSDDCNTNGVPDECDFGEYYYVRDWGTHGSGDGEFDVPYGVAVDSAGFVYVCDSANDRIQKFTSDGEYLDKWPTSGAPVDIAVDETESCCVYVTNYYFGIAHETGYEVEKFTCGGSFVDKWGEVGCSQDQFTNPAGVAVDAAGCVYVVSHACSHFQKFCALDGEEPPDFVCMSGEGQLNHPYGIAVDSSLGRVYVADSWNERVAVFDLDCNWLMNWDAGGIFGDHSPQYGIEVDSAGHVYASDSANDRVLKFTSDGLLLREWGTHGSGAGEFDVPQGVAVDLAGDVYVVDEFNHRVQKFRPHSDCNANGVLDECETDCDGDGTIDDCDDDIDNDGIVNEVDACDYTPTGASIVIDSEDPLYGTLPYGDLDGDCDCDLEDFALMQGVFTGPACALDL